MNLELNKSYSFEVEGRILTGILVRIVKFYAPCQPTNDPNKWTFHFEVQGDLRTAGVYQISLDWIKGEV